MRASIKRTRIRADGSGMSHSTRLLAAAFAVLLCTADALAEPVVLQPAFGQGDTYVLSLSASTRTAADSNGADPRRFREEVRLDYAATVQVLAVDEAGRPLRERHQGVELGFERPEEHGSMFKPGAAFDVHRDEGQLRILVNGERVDTRVEEIVGNLLAQQLEHSVTMHLLDPGRPVEVGTSWSLDPELARRFLLDRGVRVIDFDGAATARLERDEKGMLSIAYAIPIAWAEADEMPVNARTAASHARVEGRLALSDAGVPTQHVAHLELEMNGVVRATGVARAFPWKLETARHSDQRTVRIAGARLAER